MLNSCVQFQNRTKEKYIAKDKNNYTFLTNVPLKVAALSPTLMQSDITANST